MPRGIVLVAVVGAVFLASAMLHVPAVVGLTGISVPTVCIVSKSHSIIFTVLCLLPKR